MILLYLLIYIPRPLTALLMHKGKYRLDPIMGYVTKKNLGFWPTSSGGGPVVNIL